MRMPAARMNWSRAKVCCLGLAFLTLSAVPVHGQEKQPVGKGIDGATVAAYEKLGAVYGSMIERYPDFEAGRARAENGLPAFRFKTFPKAKLPEVAVPFGLDLQDSGMMDAGLKQLAHLTNLIALDLREMHGDKSVTNAGLKELAGLKNLARLNLTATRVTDAGLKELASLEKLANLDLSWTRVDGSGLKDLAGLKNLAVLNLTYLHRRLKDSGLKHLAALKNLTSLNLHSNKDLTDNGPKELASLTKLAALNLADTGITDAGMKNLADFKNLAALNISFTKVSDTGLKDLAGLKKLTSLDVSHNKVTDAALKELEAHKNLVSLGLSNEQVTDTSLHVLREFGLLYALRGYAYGKDSAQPKSAEEVISFTLYGTKATDAGLKELAVLPNLRSLELTGTKMTGAGLKDLARLKEFDTVQLNLTDECLRALRQNGLLYLLGQAKRKDGTRPRSQDEIDILRLGGTKPHYWQRFKPKSGRVMEARFKELGPLENLVAHYPVVANLTDAPLTDAALTTLAHSHRFIFADHRCGTQGTGAPQEPHRALSGLLPGDRCGAQASGSAEEAHRA
jgi:Leucine-rich repeat (LRR) protein